MAKGTVKSIKKGLGGNPPKPNKYIPTGITLIDLVMGGAPGVMGIKRGVFHRLCGGEGAGKSFLATEIVAAFARSSKKPKFVYADIEQRNTFDCQEMYGMDIIDPEFAAPETVEQLDADIGVWLKGVNPPNNGIYVVDSIDTLSNNEQEEQADSRMKLQMSGKDVSDKGSYGAATSKFWSQSFFRTKMAAMSAKDATCLLLSQVRENFGGGMYAPKFKVTGGKAVDHGCDSVVWLKVIKKLGDAERPIGAIVELETKKLTAPRPYRKVRYILYYTYGIDNIGSNVAYLFDLIDGNGNISETRAKAIDWDAAGKEPRNAKNIKVFLEEQGILKEAKAAAKEELGRSVVNAEFHAEWLNERKDEIGDAYRERFGGAGTLYTQSGLIAAIEADPEMEAALQRRVIEKWEAAEQDALVSSGLAGRKRRFG